MAGNSVTHRQVEVLCLLACGLTSSEAADQLSISEHTVVRHISNMMSAFGAKNRLELLALAVAFGVIDTACWPFRPSKKLVIHIAPYIVTGRIDQPRPSLIDASYSNRRS